VAKPTHDERRGTIALTWPGKCAPAVPDAGPLTLREVAGERAQERWQGRLVWGENSRALAALMGELRGAVDLVYIDPPFDAGGARYLRKDALEVVAYRDAWGGPGYLSMLHPRLVLLRELMRPTATIVVHVGVGVCHRVRVIMDEVFGAEQFVNQVAWKRYSAHNDAGQGARRLGAVHDVLLVYGKGPERRWTTLYAAYDEAYVKKWYRHVEQGTGRRYMSSPLTAPGGAAKGNPSYEFLGVTRHWRYGRETMEALYRAGKVFQSRPGAVPRQKHYLDEQEGVPLQDVWTDIRALQGTHAERLGFDTQKPEALLERIVQMCSRPGDLVLDAFAGSGTTAAVAARSGRRWVAIDRSPPALFTARRRIRAMQARGETGPFALLDAGPAARAELAARLGEAGVRARVLALHGAVECPEGQVHGVRAGAGVIVAGVDVRPGAAELAAWTAAGRAAGLARLEVLAWEFAPTAEAAADVSLWEIPGAVAEGEDEGPRALPRLHVELRAGDGGDVVALGEGVAAIEEWAVDWAWDGEVFAPGWSARRGRDGSLERATPPLPATATAVLVEAVDAAGAAVRKLLRYR
jgi:16S rRNA G966 N2-methylase RsmD